MNKLLFLLLVLLSPILFLQSTCAPTNSPNTDDPTVLEDITPIKGKTDCIDPAKITSKGCPENYDPVCGCDEKTYPNACEAANKGVLKWEEGVCAKDCIIEKNIKDKPCNKTYQPVCGCDGKTYNNQCLAQNAGLVHWTVGKCADDGCIDKSKISKRPCPDVYDPVCGCDGVTYTSKCNAEIRGVTSWTKGKCADSSKPERCIDPTKISMRPCPDVVDPVCGCDGKTYANSCMAKISGLTSFTKGACAEVDTDCIDTRNLKPRGCPEEYIPVCGCDGKDYPSPCEAENAGVKKWKRGKCVKTGCIDESKIKRDVPCTDIYAPVCGCNNQTYNNKCLAAISGVTSWTNGPCPK